MKKLAPHDSSVKPLDAVPAEEIDALDTRIVLIQALIPLGLDAVSALLQEEVTRLAGPRYERKEADQAHRRWGGQPGSVYLSDQKLPIQVPRVRNVETQTEVLLDAYQALQSPRQVDDGLLLRVLNGLSTRQYETCAEAVPPAFGLSSSTVSRRFIKATARKLQQFQERSLADYDLVALFVDGKTFADEEMIIALGITIKGEKIPLGFIQAASENERVCRQFIQDLIRRGLRYEEGLLALIDGSKGFYNALTKALQGYVLIQRCQWHKRENVVAYLPKNEQAPLRRKLQKAYDQETYEQAKAHFIRDRLGLMPYLKMSFRTTNCIESLNSQVGQLTRNVKVWKTSAQRYRWLATALLDIEPRLRKVKGVHYLPMLRHAIQTELNLQPQALSA